MCRGSELLVFIGARTRPLRLNPPQADDLPAMQGMSGQVKTATINFVLV